MLRTIRWGMIGCGDVAEVKSGPGFYKARNSELRAVMRRNGDLAHHTSPNVDVAAIQLDDLAMECDDSLQYLLAFLMLRVCVILRRLNARAFQNLRGQLQDLGLKAEQVFLLHEAFYDRHGRALQPAREVD